jgi:hypothetical protein
MELDHGRWKQFSRSSGRDATAASCSLGCLRNSGRLAVSKTRPSLPPNPVSLTLKTSEKSGGFPRVQKNLLARTSRVTGDRDNVFVSTIPTQEPG